MTVEAALTKLAYVLGRSDWELEQKKIMMESNLRGELTSPAKQNGTCRDSVIIQPLDHNLHVSIKMDNKELEYILLSHLNCMAASLGDIYMLNEVCKMM